MKDKFNPDLDLIRQAFENANVPVRLVGGCVRDMLLDIEPKDWDMTTPALPEEIIDILKAANIAAFDMSNGHGTITAVINGEPYEITTLRQDLETNGRHAIVGFTNDWKVDAERRDFTFNALSMDWDGNIYDYFDGVKDLKAGLVRFVGDADKRMEEDYLRILRFFRFLGRMPKPEADLKTVDKIRNNRNGLKSISGERIWAEMQKILVNNHVEFVLDLMISTGVIEAIEVELTTVKAPASKDPVTNLAAFINENFVEAIIERWKLSKAEQKQLKWLVANRNKTLTVSEMKAMLVNDVDRNFVMELMKIQNRKDDFNTVKTWNIPVFPVTGGDLIATGFKPGPEMGIRLKELKQRWIDSDYTLEKEQLI